MVGREILHYRIVEKLGEGGMGVVYLAEDTKLERKVAIKFLPRPVAMNDDERARFRNEAKAAAALNHPNIAQIYSIEEAGDEMFLVMEYIEGKELREAAGVKAGGIPSSDAPDVASGDGGHLPFDRIIDYALQIGKGLDAAHKKGVVHRDIKSSNIMITNDGNIKIMDFGLAKMQGSAQITQIGTTLGTVAYMSPQQAHGEEADVQSDIWSFGIVLYEMVTGQVPFEGAYEQSVLYSIIHEEPETVSALRPDIPPVLETVIRTCLQKDPAERYKTISEALADLGGFGNGHASQPSLIPNGQLAEKSLSFQLTNKMKFIAAGFLLVVLAGILYYSAGNSLRSWLGFGSADSEPHLIVLPFLNIGNDPGMQAFCDGLMETLTSKLTQLEQFNGSLWVVPATEVLRNKVQSAGDAHKIFGANLAVSGSLQHLNNNFRLTLNLIDAKKLRQINSVIIDVNKSNLSSIQDQSVSRLLKMLNLQMEPEVQDKMSAAGTADSRAYELYLKARGYLLHFENTENIDAAIGLFKQAIAVDSLYALAHAGLGQAYWLKYEALKDVQLVDDATRECHIAYKLDNALSPVNVTLGLIHSGTGKYAEAVQDFNRALDADPTNADAYRGLAKTYEAQNQLEKAESTYKRAIELKPDYWAGYNELGAFYYRHERYEEAAAQFQQVVKLTPDNYRGYNNLGAIYYLLERWEKAREMFEHSFSLHKSYTVASNLGTLYYIEGQYADAARSYEKALKLNSSDQLVWGNLASAYYWTPGERDKAQKYYRKAIELAEKQQKVNPNDAATVAQLAGYYSMTGDKEKAINLVKESLKISPDDAQIMFRAGTTYEQLGDRKEAIYWIGKALQNGYARSEIEHQPELKKLLADPKFKQLLAKKEGQSGE